MSVNAQSARYRELKEDSLYIPYDWDEDEISEYVNHMQKAYVMYHKTLQHLVDKGYSKKRAKEVSRLYLPYANQIVSDISFNFRSFMHFQGLLLPNIYP